MQRPLKVMINAQMIPGGREGGIEQFLMGLVYGLGRLTDGEEQYILFTSPESPDWLKTLMGPNQRIVSPSRPKTNKLNLLDRAKGLLGPLRRPAGALWRGARRRVSGGTRPRSAVNLPQSDGFLESLGGDIVHFPFQAFTRCSLPSIYNPWDLQHLHFPQFFSDREIAFRQALYSGACHSAQAVVAPSCAVKSDLVQQYGLDAQKVFVVHCAPPAALYQDIENGTPSELHEKFRLPDLFGLFPAQTWPHKNHLKLLEAVRQVRDRNGITLNLFCPGRKNEYWPVIRQRINDLGLQAQVIFPGFVDLAESQAFYRLAQFVVFPSLFEGAGMPVIEAFREGVPVTCSDIPPLREYGGDAVLTFDPQSVESIAASLLRISSDEALREQLRARGRERARMFTWERTAKTCRALYRKVAGVPLTEEDLHLLPSHNLC
ncbi:MAG: glycosyltransferase family 1 protein [Terriglobia bacterium]|jgi:glycosyltransferase involved in cell wall biosynthesis